VRTDEEFKNGHLEGALNIPVDSLRDRLGELDKNKTIVEYCQVGLRGYIADRILSQHGFKVLNVTGGYKTSSMLNYDPLKQAEGKTEESSDFTIDPDTQEIKVVEKKNDKYDKAIDLGGVCCAGQLLKVKESIESMDRGQILKATASDTEFVAEIEAWSKRTGNEMTEVSKDARYVTIYIRKS